MGNGSACGDKRGRRGPLKRGRRDYRWRRNERGRLTKRRGRKKRGRRTKRGRRGELGRRNKRGRPSNAWWQDPPAEQVPAARTGDAHTPRQPRRHAAIGRAGLPDLLVEQVGLYLNDVLIAERGCRAESYTEAQGVAAMAPEDIVIRVELGRGDASAEVWTTDFSYDYVRINAEYRS